MRYATCWIGLAVLGVAGCASAPKAVPISSIKADSRNAVVSYMLPRTTFAASASWERRTYTPGVLSKDLAEWYDAKKSDPCTAAEAMNPLSLCYWSLWSAKTPAGGTVLQCETAEGPWVSLVRSSDPTLTEETHWDTDEHYAVVLDRPAFQTRELQLEFSPFGTLGGYSAKSTSLVAETIEKVVVDAATMSLDAGSPASTLRSGPNVCDGSVALCDLVQKMAALEALRPRAALSNDPKGALAAIDEQIKFLRVLAEGSERTAPYTLKLKWDDLAPSCPADGEEQSTKPCMESCPLPEPHGEKTTYPDNQCRQVRMVSLPTDLKCKDAATTTQATVTFRVKADQAVSAALTLADEANKVSDPALYYRSPIPASPLLTIECSGPAIADAARCRAENGTFSNGFPTTLVPQWGPTLALPRHLGWRSGSLTAKLDPKTGALLTMSASSQGSLEAAVVNGLYAAETARRAAEKAAAGKDSERAAMERERAILEDRVKICAARRTLGEPPGEECPE